MPRRALMTALLVTIIGATGCSVSPAPPPPAHAEPPPPEGHFPVIYEEPSSLEYAEIKQQLEERGALDRIAADVDDHLRPPIDLPVVVHECGEANAFYDPEKQRLEVCYELVDEFQTLFAEDENPPDVVDTKVDGVLTETYLHELGHGLIDILELPITGPEEDSADGMAAYWLTNTEGGADMVIDAADSYRLNSERTDVEDLPFYDSHSLDVQRYASHLCYLYGSDPEQFQYLVDDGNLPEDRAETCTDEYDSLSSGWQALLSPYAED